MSQQSARGNPAALGTIPYESGKISISFNSTRLFMGMRAEGSYTEGLTTGFKGLPAGAKISGIWIREISGSLTPNTTVCTLRDSQAGADLGLAINLDAGVAGGSASGSLSLTGSEDLRLAVDASGGWSGTFIWGFYYKN